MAIPKTISVPIDRELRTPTRCLNCGQADPDDKVTLRARTERRGAYLSDDVFKKYFATLPCCKPCAGKIRRAIWLDNFVLAICLIIYIALMILYSMACAHFAPVYMGKHNWIRTVFGGALALVLLIVTVWVKTTLYTPPVVVSRKLGKLHFSFRDPAYADEFEKMNQ